MATLNPKKVARQMLGAALEYARAGIPVFPCARKKPLVSHGFKDATTDAERIYGWWTEHPDAQIAMPTGSITHRMTLDIDSPTAALRLEELEAENGALPATCDVRTRTGRRQIHLSIPDGAIIKTNAGWFGVVGFDTRGDGGYCILPPSIHHETGKPYQYLVEMPPALAPEWVLRLFAKNGTSDRAEQSPESQAAPIPEHTRNSHLASLSGTMRHRGMSRETSTNALLEENVRRCKPPLPEAEVRGIIDSIWRYPAGTAGRAAPAEWGEPKPLDPELPKVQPFAPEWLPSPLQEKVELTADSMQLPPDLAATNILGALAAVTGRRIQVQSQRLNTAWTESGNLWLVNIAPSGCAKSPTLHEIVKPIEAIQAEWFRLREVDMHAYQEEKQRIDLEQQVWESAARAAMRAGVAPPPRPDPTLWEPGQRRIFTSDGTQEKVQQIMEQNPAGLSVIRDELSGFFADLTKSGRESERQFWLTAWNGNGGHTTDRVGRGTVNCTNVCASMLGGVTPARMRRYMEAVTLGTEQDDGLYQRYLYCWPDIAGRWEYRDVAPNSTIDASLDQIYRRIVRLSATDPLRMRFSPDAQRAYIDWRTELENSVRGGSLGGPLAGCFSKFKKHLPTIAGLLQLVAMSQRGNLDNLAVEPEPYVATMRRRRIVVDAEQFKREDSNAHQISEENLARAISICSYYQSHAKRTFACVISPAVSAAHRLADHVQQGDLRDGFTSREVLRHNWTGLTTSESIVAALNHLTDLDWIRAAPVPTTSQGGRPSVQYAINPKIQARKS